MKKTIFIFMIIAVLFCACTPGKSEESQSAVTSQSASVVSENAEVLPSLSFVELNSGEEEISQLLTDGIYKFTINPDFHTVLIRCYAYNYGEEQWEFSVTVDKEKLREQQPLVTAYICDQEGGFTIAAKAADAAPANSTGAVEEFDCMYRVRYLKNCELEIGKETAFLVMSSDLDGVSYPPDAYDSGEADNLKAIEHFLKFTIQLL